MHNISIIFTILWHSCLLVNHPWVCKWLNLSARSISPRGRLGSQLKYGFWDQQHLSSKLSKSMEHLSLYFWMNCIAAYNSYHGFNVMLFVNIFSSCVWLTRIICIDRVHDKLLLQLLAISSVLAQRRGCSIFLFALIGLLNTNAMNNLPFLPEPYLCCIVIVL